MAFVPPTMTLRTVKGSPLTWAEDDANVSGLRDFCRVIGQLFNPDGSVDPTLLQSILLNYVATAFIGNTSPFLQPVGQTIWVPKALDPSVILPDNGTSWLRCDGAKYLQNDYPKLFAYLGHDYDTDSAITGVAVSALSNTHIATVAVHSGGGGSGYVANDVLTIAGGTGTKATVKVTAVSGGAITAISVLTCGDYTSNPTLTANVPTGGSGGGTASLDLTTFSGGGGSGYTVGDTLILTGGTGAAASVKVTGTNVTSVSTVSVITLGSYTTAPPTPNPAARGTGTGVSLDLTFSSSVNIATEFRVPLLDGSFLFGADGDFPVGWAGGEKTHKLILAELPSTLAFPAAATGIWAREAGSGTTNLTGSGGTNDGLVTLPKGSDLPHNCLPPFRSGIFYMLSGFRVNGSWV